MPYVFGRNGPFLVTIRREVLPSHNLPKAVLLVPFTARGFARQICLSDHLLTPKYRMRTLYQAFQPLESSLYQTRIIWVLCQLLRRDRILGAGSENPLFAEEIEEILSRCRPVYK